MESRMQRLPMPPTEARLAQVVTMLLKLSYLLELRVTVTGIEVRRQVEDEEPVVPETIVEIAKGLVPEEPELSFLLRSIELDALEHDPARHQLTTLIAMTENVRKRGLLPAAWYVAEGDGLDAFLAQPTGTLSTHLFGAPVHYVAEDALPEGKLLLVGSATRFSIDATYGVTTDIGG